MKHSQSKGFTLIEILLVLVVVSMLIVMAIGYVQQRTLTMRIDRTASQMQQILNAGLAYYVANGTWPSSLACLQGVGVGCTQQYLPKTLISPWGGGYILKSVPNGPGVLYVFVSVTTGSLASSTAYASAIAGQVPLGYVTGNVASAPPPQSACVNPSVCYVVGMVNVPGQNLNNASAVNYAGVYHHGACVPVPICPVDANGNTMTPKIMVVPASVAGINDSGSPNQYPITSFEAYATGGTDASPPACTYGALPPMGTGNGNCSSSDVGTTKYWRVCLDVVTQKGDVAQTNNSTSYNYVTPPYVPWGGNVSLMAFTRCSITKEATGSPITIYSQ